MLFEHALGGGVLVADVVDHLAVTVDRDALGDEVLLDHVDQVLSLDVFRVTARGEPVRIQVGLAVQLHDARGDLVGVLLFLVCMLQELGLDRVCRDTLGHEVVPLVAEYADDLRRQRLVEELEYRLAVRRVAGRDRAFHDVLAGAPPEHHDVRQERLFRRLGHRGILRARAPST